MIVNLSIESNVFVEQLAQEIEAGGLSIVDAVERIFGERMEFSNRESPH